MFNLGKKSSRNYKGNAPKPTPLNVKIKITLEKKTGNYDSEVLSNSEIDAVISVNTDGKIQDIRDAIEQQLGYALAPLDAVLETDPRLTDGAYAKQIEEENETE